HDPLGERPPRPWREDDPLRVEAGRDEETANLGRFTQIEVGVGREALRCPQVMLEPEVPQLRQALARLREDLTEVIPIRAELTEPVVADVIRRTGFPFRLERPDDVRASVVANVEVPVQISEDREAFDRVVGLDGSNPDMLGGIEGEAHAREASDL